MNSEDPGSRSARRASWEEAAALRWFLARQETQDISPHEVLEYRAAEGVLRSLEGNYPGLRQFIEQVTDVATIAAEARLARVAGLPGEVIAALELATQEGVGKLSALLSSIPAGKVNELLSSYASLADLAGVLQA